MSNNTSSNTELIINATLPETRIALLEDGEIQELLIERDSERGIVGNIYKGKVIRVLPGMQAAFVDIGLEKAAFLYVDDIFFPDMNTPLQTNPLPEPIVAKPVVQPLAKPLPPVLTTANEPRQGRFGRDRRGRGQGRRGEMMRGPAPAPGTPEAHALLQREYAKQMLDIEDEFEAAAHSQRRSEQKARTTQPEQGAEECEGQFDAQHGLQHLQHHDTLAVDAGATTETPPATETQVTEQPAEFGAEQPAAIAAGGNPQDFETEQPEARSPRSEPTETAETADVEAQSAERAGSDAEQTFVPEPEEPEPEEDDEFDDLDEDGEDHDGVIYRAEPLIDPEAWAEEVARANRRTDTAGETSSAVTPGAEPSAEAQPVQADQASEAGDQIASERAAETPTSTEQQLSGEQPIVARGPVLPTVVPLAPGDRPAPIREERQEEEDDEDEEGMVSMPRRRRRREPVNIADLVKEGQEILVQVAKDPIGTKGARLTCHVSLPGRYLVFMPTVDHIGVSRRIESEGERRRLKDTMARVRPSKTGVIVRTASGKQTDRKLKSDLDYLVSTWNDIQRKFKKQRTPSMVYQDLTIVLRAIRDMFTDEVDKVTLDSKREYKGVMRFVSRFIPNLKNKVELYEGPMPIFDAYGIEPEIQRSLERKVWLKSGGYLVVDQAEALVAIDVNTGRYVGKKTLEETILKTNLEAVKEIAYQLRLRNAGGIIILDLIDMEKESNRDKVYKALEEALRKDRARPTILKISQLGLVEMTRKRTRDSMVRSLCEPCAYCEGKGYVKNKLTIAYDIMRDMEREGLESQTQALSIQCHPSVADVLLEDKRDVIEALEHRFNKKITVRGNGAYHVEQYELVAHRGEKNVLWSSEERRQLVRQRIQEHMQQIAAQQRKQEQVDREQRRREEREKQAEKRKAAQERREAQRQARLAQRAQERAERDAAAVRSVTGQAFDDNALGQEPGEFREALEGAGEGETAISDAPADGDSADGVGVEENADARGASSNAGIPGSEQDDERGGRRGRRGRGRRDRGPQVYIPAIHGAPTGPVPNVKPVEKTVPVVPVIDANATVTADNVDSQVVAPDNIGNSIVPSESVASEEAAPSGYAEPGNIAEDLEGEEEGGAQDRDQDVEEAEDVQDVEDGVESEDEGSESAGNSTESEIPRDTENGDRRDPRRRRGRRGGRFRYRKRPQSGGQGQRAQQQGPDGADGRKTRSHAARSGRGQPHRKAAIKQPAVTLDQDDDSRGNRIDHDPSQPRQQQLQEYGSQNYSSPGRSGDDAARSRRGYGENNDDQNS